LGSPGGPNNTVAVAPRQILRRQVAAGAALGFSAAAATELEYYLFRTGYRDAARAGFATSVLLDLTAGVAAATTASAIDALQAAGITLTGRPPGPSA